jgi:2,3-bisphosphoglycerate-independent phosphoglycerate mutase
MFAEYLAPLVIQNNKKIVMLIMDGVGGLPLTPDGKTELETAVTPNMDKLAKTGTLGQAIPIHIGVTPGSGPAHLSLFGYDPFKFFVGRGPMAASGVGVNVNTGDVACRVNFCTLDEQGNVLDRRAGRIPNEIALPIVEKLKSIEIPGVEVEVAHVREYRFSIIMRGEGLDPRIADTDSQQTGVPPLKVTPVDPAAQKTAEYFDLFLQKARALIKDEPKANGMLLRGFGTNPNLPSFFDRYKLKAACIAVYPMYRGVSKLCGMDIIDFEGAYPADEFKALAEHWDDYDFFFVHIKKTDSTGEDGNFDGKVKVIESVDQALPELLKLNPDVLIITGDHSTPALMKMHSWHPVPVLLSAPERAIPDEQSTFGERSCSKGALGTVHGTDLMPLALAHADKLGKYGA